MPLLSGVIMGRLFTLCYCEYEYSTLKPRFFMMQSESEHLAREDGMTFNYVKMVDQTDDK